MTNISTTTLITPLPPIPLGTQLLDYFCLLIAAVGYGLNYLPIKHYETGDGFFFQFVLCMGVWVSGVPVYIYRGYPKFYMLPCIGGFFWATGNLATVPVIKFIGIGLGSLYWNICGLLVGWAIPRYGWFGVQKQVPSNILMNYIGVVLAISSIIVFVLVKPEAKGLEISSKRKEKEEEESAILYNEINSSDQEGSIDENNNTTINNAKRTRVLKNIAGIVLSSLSGVFYSMSVTTIDYVQTNYPGASDNQNDYAFAYNSGIFLGSLFYFVAYCIYMKNKPRIYSEIMLPGMISGAIWLIANSCYFLATTSLSQSITYPAVNCGPSAVAFVASLFYKEIKGAKNLSITLLGCSLALVGTILCGLSR